MSLADLCPQLSALEKMFPQFVTHALPAVRLAFNFEPNAENLAGFILQWGGWKDERPEQSILAACRALDDPEALLAALLTLSTAAHAAAPEECYQLALPVFLKGIPSPYPVPLIVDSEEGMMIPEIKPTNDAEGLVWLLVVSLRNCARAMAGGEE